MKIAIGSDHAGVGAKDEVKRALAGAGHELTDVGTQGDASVDYPDFARAVGAAVASGEADRGVLICGTGIGMSMTANKVEGVRAALVHDEFTVRMSRRHNDANVVCLGARLLAVSRMTDLVEIFLAEPFEGGRHQRRVDKISTP